MNDVQHWQRVTQERERLSARPIWLGAVGFGAITGLGMIMAWLVLQVAEPEARAVSATTSSGRGWVTRETGDEVNGMRTSLFPANERRVLDPAPVDPAAARLGAYGWVDREQRIIHVPIARAKELYVERQRRHAALPERERLGR